MNKHIAVLAGDGIGPEITDGAIAVLQAVGKKYGHEFTFEPLLMGCCAIEKTGEPLPAYTVERPVPEDARFILPDGTVLHVRASSDQAATPAQE